MSTTRREFLQTSVRAGAVLGLGAVGGVLAQSASSAASRKQGMKLLILGGTGFIGPALVEIAQGRGHKVSVFNRGQTEERIGRLPGEVERLVGDRDPDKGEGLKSLEGGTWDAVIDNSGYYPRMVKASAQLLEPNVKQYIFVSSISAYASSAVVGADETATRATLTNPAVETMGAGGEFYGGLKALCEQAVEETFKERATIVRPGFIVGPGDPTDRYTYWPVRVEKGGEILAPGTPDDPLQIIDVRDLAAWMIHIAEENATGAFNACGPDKKLSFGEMIKACQQACGEGSKGANATVTWASAEFLESYPASLYLPLWVPPTGETAGFHTWSNARAVKAGLKFRPVAETSRDLLQWWPKEIERRTRVGKQMIDDAVRKGNLAQSLTDLVKIRAGVTPEAETKALEAWHEHAKTK